MASPRRRMMLRDLGLHGRRRAAHEKLTDKRPRACPDALLNTNPRTDDLAAIFDVLFGTHGDEIEVYASGAA